MWRVQFGLFLFLQGNLLVENAKVSTPLGEILGSTLTTHLGKTVYAFRGIRYAEPPINNLRFKPPVPIKKWPNGIYNATVDGPVCPQPSDDPVSEDCLFLNVYTTHIPVGRKSVKRPVILYIHAGGYYSGTGRSNWIGPQYFLDQDIVLVTINYRLGSLGFLSLGREVPGNNGLKDQVVAMTWVKHHIECFGGDSNSITIFGYSAGATSVTLHLVSPMSRGLFHKAIVGSGSAVGEWVLPKNQLDLAKKQARVLGCPDTSPKKILDCLKTKSALDLGNSLPEFDEFGTDPIYVWYPIIEEDYGQPRFLPEHPIKLIEKGQFQNVPVIAGITKDEFGYKAITVVNNSTLVNKLNQEFEKIAPICFIYERETNKSKKVSAGIREFYLNNKPVSRSTISGLAQVYADSVTGFSVNRAVDLVSKKSSLPVYYYDFTYQGRFSHYYLPGTNQPYGVVHHDDLIYLFYVSPIFPFFNSSFPEVKMVEKLTLLYTNFAKTGTPTLAVDTSLDNVTWEKYNNTCKKYLDIGEKLTMKENLYGERYEFWQKMFPLSTYL